MCKWVNSRIEMTTEWMGHLTPSLWCGMSDMPSVGHPKVPCLIPTVPRNLSALYFSGSRRLFDPQTVIFHIRENCRLLTSWSSLTKDQEVKRFLGTSMFIVAIWFYFIEASLSMDFLKSVSPILLSDKCVRKRYNIGIPSP